MESQIRALELPNPEIKIRPVRLTDVQELHATCWSDRPQAIIHQLISRAQQYAIQGRGLGVVVVGEGGALIGFGQLTVWPRCGEISDLIIRDDQRSRGLGTTIIQYLVRVSREMHLPCVEIGAALSNPRAVALYRRLGFMDIHQIQIDLGEGDETVQYLRLDLGG